MGNFICFSFDPTIVCMHVTSVKMIEKVQIYRASSFLEKQHSLAANLKYLQGRFFFVGVFFLCVCVDLWIGSRIVCCSKSALHVFLRQTTHSVPPPKDALRQKCLICEESPILDIIEGWRGGERIEREETGELKCIRYKRGVLIY